MIARAVLGLIALLLLAPPAFAAKGEEQAARQLEFARKELNAGDFGRAIKSAESAFRLDPTAYEAIVIKALSYEALGELERAEDLLAAYLDFTQTMQPDPRVGEAMERLREAERKRRGLRGRSDAVVPIEEHEESTRTLIAAGRCDEALVPARDWLETNRAEPRAFTVLGDVQRCARRLRSAAIAYRRAVELGSTDPALLAMLYEVEDALGTLVVKLRAPTSAVADVVVLLGVKAVEPDSFDRGVARFELLPIGAPLELAVGGRGFQPETVGVPALNGREVRRVEVSPRWLGIGTVAVGGWPGGIDRVEIVEGREVRAVQAGDKLQVGAGEAVARITNRAGQVDVPLVVQRSREVYFEPGRYIPAGLVVEGLPTGSTVEIQVAGRSDHVVSHAVPRGGGTLDATTGALIAPPQEIPGLVAGATTLRVNHPTLGLGAQAITLIPAQSNAVVFDQAQLPGTADLQARWAAHSARPAKAKVNVPALGAGIGGGVALALGGIFAGLSAQSASQQRTLYDSYVATSGTGADAVDLFNQYQLQRGTTQDRTTLAGIFGGIGVIGIGVAIPLGLVKKPKASAASDWQPEGF